MARKRLFCELGPTAYKISLYKQIIFRHLKNLFSSERFTKTKIDEPLPEVIYSVNGDMIKKGPGINPQLQINKADNIRLACSKINGLIINPGDTFSFWKLVGKTSQKHGFLEGRILRNGKLVAGSGGGLCNLANFLHIVVMHSPMTVTELHHHSDALAPDEGGVRKPYSAGTSVNYNFLDFRFRNDTDKPVQLMTYCIGDILSVELRARESFKTSYRIVEEDHHFAKEEDGCYYRKSRIYRETIDNETGQVKMRELKWDNKSKVMFDSALIPNELIR